MNPHSRSITIGEYRIRAGPNVVRPKGCGPQAYRLDGGFGDLRDNIPKRLVNQPEGLAKDMVVFVKRRLKTAIRAVIEDPLPIGLLAIEPAQEDCRLWQVE